MKLTKPTQPAAPRSTGLRRLSTLAALGLTFSLAGCASSEPVPPPPYMTGEADPIVVEPAQTAPAVPKATLDPLAKSGSFQLTTYDGYEATVNFTWHQPTEVDYATANDREVNRTQMTYTFGCADNAMQSFRTVGGDAEDSSFRFVRVQVTGSISYQVANGFSWPDSIEVRPTMDSDSQQGGWLCGDAVLPGPDATNKSFFIEILFDSVRTPDNPDANIEVGPDLYFGLSSDGFSGSFGSYY